MSRFPEASYGEIGYSKDALNKVAEPSGEELIIVPVMIENRQYTFSIAFGSITDAKTSAILCPTAGTFDKVVLGGPSGAILRVSGLKNIETELQEEAKRRLGPSYNPLTGKAPVGFSLAHESGKLKSHGINHIIFTNVTQEGDEGLNPQYVTKCVSQAMAEANRIGDDSLAFPAFETGIAGLPLESSIMGSLWSLMVYHDSLNGQVPRTTKLVEVLFYQPSAHNISYIGEILDRATRTQ